MKVRPLENKRELAEREKELWADRGGPVKPCGHFHLVIHPRGELRGKAKLTCACCHPMGCFVPAARERAREWADIHRVRGRWGKWVRWMGQIENVWLHIWAFNAVRTEVRVSESGIMLDDTVTPESTAPALAFCSCFGPWLKQVPSSPEWPAEHHVWQSAISCAPSYPPALQTTPSQGHSYRLDTVDLNWRD